MSDSEDKYDSDEAFYNERLHKTLDEEDSDFEKVVGAFPIRADLDAFERVKRYRHATERWRRVKDERVWLRKHGIPRGRSIFLHSHQKQKGIIHYQITIYNVNGEYSLVSGERTTNQEIYNLFVDDDYRSYVGFECVQLDGTKAKPITRWSDIDDTKMWGKCLKAILNDWKEFRKVF